MRIKFGSEKVGSAELHHLDSNLTRSDQRRLAFSTFKDGPECGTWIPATCSVFIRNPPAQSHHTCFDIVIERKQP